jgi:hypothetical protein
MFEASQLPTCNDLGCTTIVTGYVQAQTAASRVHVREYIDMCELVYRIRIQPNWVDLYRYET